jgi:hypothetical protein
MRTNMNRIAQTVVSGAAVFLALSCNSVNRESSPVKLVVTNDQALHQIDLSPTASNCNQNIATVNLQSVLLQDQINTNLPTDNRFNDIKIDRYQIQYVRTDGGKAIPQPFVRAISGIIVAGGSSSLLTTFVAFEPDAVTQAPFASLLPVNGGRDPETGKDFVQMDIILTVYGQTLAGERVSGTTRIPLTFCFATCNGCS